MKLAPNVKKQPRGIKHKDTEVIIFAGSDAWSHAKQWQEQDGPASGDNVPPVWLGPNQLAELDALKIVPDGKKRVRLYQAGELDLVETKKIGQKLAAADIQDANFYPEGMHVQKCENWRRYLNAERENIAAGLTMPEQKNTQLAQMADSERAQLLAERFDGVCVHQESEIVHVWRGGVWCPVSTMELSREMVVIYSEHRATFSKRVINNAVEALKVIAEPMGEPSGDLLPFANGALDLKTGEFSPHTPENWITTHNGIEYTPPAPGENIRDNALNFHKWLEHAAGKDQRKMMRICAALYMIMANRYDWQMFIEATGDGGSGKSTFTHIASLLAGKQNTVSAEMTSLDDAGGRAQVVGSRLIVLADQPKYTGEGTGIKKITGGDPVEINPKYEKRFTAVIRAVVLATNNNPMIFTERAGGVARRRVIFRFDNIVSEAEKDRELPEKIAAEIPVIIRRLLANFTDSEKARALLLEQRDGDEALAIKQQTDPVIEFCQFLNFLEEARGLMMGGGGDSVKYTTRNSLYRVYLAFMAYAGRSKPLNVNDFGKAMKPAAKVYGHEYITRKVKGVTQTNAITTDECDAFL
ncbi:bacteriophage P4 DNA primase [Shigella flexneri]|uniref:Bacteriophage P4 DNA primase n=6 Tax=Shigella flexneri TaxID=623 RepID=A0A0H2VUU5_SHIFL|nr:MULTISPECIES: phage/plasmid primase, P4 family [Shigella]NP_707046.2 bacteriophage P4 DNA primase [Shigella flexneri 2a str. 301]EET2938741.1 DNA primase [Escherichia coli]EFP6976624.1 DNA primase [Shigella sonnei]EGK38600.1 phage/plasmid primase [Shigella flexneri K-304]HAY5685919.1 DNA primase [Shigella flexneri 2b]AAN42753.2 Bacteriophage P4 DNA primase [Shigella flexneri 2a str. 301]